MHEARRRGALLDVTLPVCLYAGSGVMPGVRGPGRGRYPRPEGEDPGQRGEPPYKHPSPRPSGHDVDLSRTRPGFVRCRKRRSPRHLLVPGTPLS